MDVEKIRENGHSEKHFAGRVCGMQLSKKNQFFQYNRKKNSNNKIEIDEVNLKYSVNIERYYQNISNVTAFSF